MIRHSFSLTLLVVLAGSLALPMMAQGQTASALIREGEALPGDTLGTSISGIGNTAVNGVGGYAFTVTTDGTFSHVWGDTNGGAGGIFQSEATIGSLAQTSFESYFWSE